MSLLPLGLERGSSVAVEADLAQISDKFKYILKNILICVPKDERRSYGFRTK